MHAQRHYARPRQCGHIHDGFGLHVGRIRQRIAQYQPPFRIRIKHFHGFAGIGFNNIAGMIAGMTGNILRRRNQPDEVEFELQFRRRHHNAYHVAAAGFIVFHGFHTPCGFQAQSAGIERNRFAHERHIHRFVARIPAAILQHNQPRFACRPRPHRQQGVHLHGLQLPVIKHLAL